MLLVPQILPRKSIRGFAIASCLLLVFFCAASVVYIFVAGQTCGGGSYYKEAEIEVGNLSSMVEQYMLKGSPPELPETLDQLAEGRNPITKKVPLDPWGEPYIYYLLGDRKFALFSSGPDRKPFTDDDIHAYE